MSEELRFDSETPYAVIIGLENIQALQAARILSGHNIPIVALTINKDYYTCKTRVCDRIFVVEEGSEPIVVLLEELGPKFKHKPVLVPCSDANVTTVSHNRDRLTGWYHVLLPDADVVDMLMDKTQFYQHAQKTGLSMPPTFYLHNREEAEAAADELSFPAVLKPPYRPKAWSEHTSLKAFKLNSREEFMACFDEYKPFVDILIAQGWIEGDDTTLYSCNCYFDRNSKPLVTFTARKLRQWPPRVGQSCLGEEVRADPVLEETIKLFESVHYRGLGYVEMKYDKRSNRYYMVEPNIGRPTGRSAIAEAGGVELLYTMYCDAVGWPLPENRVQTYGNVKWIHVLRDVRSALFYWRAGELTLREYLRSISGRKSYAVLSLRDPLPFFAALWGAIPLPFKRKEDA